MSKAIQGAALLAGAVAIGAVEFELASTGVGVSALPFLTHAMEALALGGLAMEAGAIASALTNNRGMGITTRQAASARQIIYGTQRVGGVIVYQSTTGSHKDQYNFIIVLAGHVCTSILGLYLDGRKVNFDPNSAGYSVQNGVGFGGNADGNDYTGPNGQPYNFGGSVYCEARYGNQVSGNNGHLGVIEGMTANDPTWAVTSLGSPDLMGCTYVYLKLEYNTGLFPSLPEMRFTVMGKPVADPRTGTTAYSSNWALIANDILCDTVFGLGDPRVNQAQLIAAANVCDEQVEVEALVAAGTSPSTEARYNCHMHYDTSTPPSDALDNMMMAAAGRISDVGGEYYLWPAYWQGPSFNFDYTSLTGNVQWTPTRSFKDLFNRVTGTYVAPNYPYNVAGNLYDSNGWYDGTLQNNFPYAFQPTNFPEFACDTLHGYPADQYLLDDTGSPAPWSSTTVYETGDVCTYGGAIWKSLLDDNQGYIPPDFLFNWGLYSNALPREISLQTILSVSQAQRVAKIVLLRNRQQGSGRLELNLSAAGMQPVDVMNFTFPALGWQDKQLEIFGTEPFRFVPGQGDDDPPSVRFGFSVQETAETVYEWDPAVEELTVYDVPAAPVGGPGSIVAPPTNLQLISSAGTALVAPDGTVTPRLQVSWDEPLDAYVTQIQMQYQLTGAPAWTDGGSVDVSLVTGYISPVVAAATYDVRIRSLRANGLSSVWVTVNGFVPGLVVASQTQDGVGQGSLTPSAFPDGTATIQCNPFTAHIGQLELAIFPAGAVTLSLDGTIGGSSGAIQQRTLYWVYYRDPTTVGGNVTPIATTNKADFLGKLGYWLIDNVVTPYASAGTTRYLPTTYSDSGFRATSNPAQAFDGNLGTAAFVSATAYTSGGVSPSGGATPVHEHLANGNFTLMGYPSVVLAAPATLNVTASANCSNGSGVITASVGGTSTTMLTSSSDTVSAVYSLALAAGVDISTVGVNFAVSATDDGSGNTFNASLQAYEASIDL